MDDEEDQRQPGDEEKPLLLFAEEDLPIVLAMRMETERLDAEEKVEREEADAQKEGEGEPRA